MKPDNSLDQPATAGGKWPVVGHSGRYVICLALAAAHIVAGAWGRFAGGDRLAAIVAGSIYLPLWPLAKLGVPVFHQSGWFFSPPTYIGWIIVVVFWLVTYWYVAAMVVRFLPRRKRAN